MVSEMTRDEPLKNRLGSLKPMPFWQALLYFGLPALLFRICLYGGIPALIRLGLSSFEAAAVSFIVPSAILFALAFGVYKHDGFPLSWDDISVRFRLRKMTGQELVHGRSTWLIHGLLWLLWHIVFYPWQAIALLPICLALPYIAQRRQNTWVAIIIHLQNGVFQLLVLGMVLGLF